MKEKIFYIHNGDSYTEYANDMDYMQKFIRDIGSDNIITEKFLSTSDGYQRIQITYKDKEAMG